jgi:flagellar basal-body rod modification protein FlgD
METTATTASTAAAQTTGTQSSQTQGSNQLGKDAFVKLLLAQLANQDPTSPVDSQAFVAQLAQFANVELLQSANSRLDSILYAQAAGNQTTVASLVGKEVVYRADTVTLTAGQSTSVQVNLASKADQVTAVVTDSSGKTVRTMNVGACDKGASSIPWDGRDDAGNQLPAGDYKVNVTAATKDGTNVTVEQRARARVTGVSFENGYPELVLNSGSQRIKLSDVIEVDEGSSTSASNILPLKLIAPTGAKLIASTHAKRS